MPCSISFQYESAHTLLLLAFLHCIIVQCCGDMPSVCPCVLTWRCHSALCVVHCILWLWQLHVLPSVVTLTALPASQVSIIYCMYSVHLIYNIFEVLWLLFCTYAFPRCQLGVFAGPCDCLSVCRFVVFLQIPLVKPVWLTELLAICLYLLALY